MRYDLTLDDDLFIEDARLLYGSFVGVCFLYIDNLACSAQIVYFLVFVLFWGSVDLVACHMFGD